MMYIILFCVSNIQVVCNMSVRMYMLYITWNMVLVDHIEGTS